MNLYCFLQNAPVSWRKNQKLLEHYSESTSDDGAVTTNFLTFVPSKEDNGKLLACTAINEQFSNFRIEDTLHLDVHCNYDQALLPLLCLSLPAKHYWTFLLCVDAPILSLLLGASAQRQEILEGSNVYFDCNIQVSWQTAFFLLLYFQAVY